MADNNKVEQGKAVFSSLRRVLDKNQWQYKMNEENLSITCVAKGEDLPIDLVIKVDAERMLVILLSRMPFTIKDELRIEAAVAVSAVNNILVDGCFDYDITNGEIFFRMTNSYCDSTIGTDVLEYLVYCSCHTIDDYNEKLLLLSNGTLTLESFISIINK